MLSYLKKKKKETGGETIKSIDDRNSVFSSFSSALDGNCNKKNQFVIVFHRQVTIFLGLWQEFGREDFRERRVNKVEWK